MSNGYRDIIDHLPYNCIVTEYLLFSILMNKVRYFVNDFNRTIVFAVPLMFLT